MINWIWEYKLKHETDKSFKFIDLIQLDKYCLGEEGSMIWSVAAMAPQLGSIDGSGRGNGARPRQRSSQIPNEQYIQVVVVLGDHLS